MTSTKGNLQYIHLLDKNTQSSIGLVYYLQGYKTGYVYRNPEVFHGEKPPEREVTTPSTVSSTRAKMFYTPEIERTPVRRAHSTGRANTYRNRVKWLNTPVKSTEYKKDKEKVELESDEPVTIKDLVPERVDKDLEQVKAFMVGLCNRSIPL